MGPLDGIRVLEISDTQAGCVAGMLLSDYGATVTRIDPPSSDGGRSRPGFVVWNRGKRSITLDLEQAQARAALLRLLEQSDVLIETLGPGETARLGLDYATLQPRFPQLVSCSITGYDLDGPDRDRPPYDGLVEARGGIMRSGPVSGGIPPSFAQGGTGPGPKSMGFPAPSYAAAFYGTLGISAALVARRKTGRGQQVNSSMFSAALAMSRRAWAEHPGSPRAGLGQARGLYGIWRCQDGGWIWTHTGARGSFDRFMQVFGLEEFMAAAPNPLPWTPEEAERLRARVKDLMLSKPRDEWVRLFNAADCPNQAALPPGACFDDEQANVVNMVVSVDDPELGRLQEVGVPIKFALTPGAVLRSAPLAGEHTHEVLREVGLSEAEIALLGRESEGRHVSA